MAPRAHQAHWLDTQMILAADDRVVAGLLIQRMPVEGGANLGVGRNQDQNGLNEDYGRIALLAGTLTRGELLDLDEPTLLRRLFFEATLRRFESLGGDAGPRFACNCSRERVGSMLEGLGRDEIDAIVVEQGRVEIACDFCGRKYHFDPVDVGALFTPARRQMRGSDTIN